MSRSCAFESVRVVQTDAAHTHERILTCLDEEAVLSAAAGLPLQRPAWEAGGHFRVHQLTAPPPSIAARPTPLTPRHRFRRRGRSVNYRYTVLL